MPETNLFLLFTVPLERLAIPYMVTGSVASILYGEPRFTQDVDLVIDLNEGHASQIGKAFPQTEFYCPPEEVIRIEIARQRRGHFNLIHHDTGFKADVYLMGDSELHRWAMPNRRLVKIGSEQLAVARPEYVILRKLEFYREGHSGKHLRDTRPF